MNLTLDFQVSTFLTAMVIGVVLCLLYECFRVVNALLKFNEKRVFFEDIIYFILCAILTFLHILVTNQGEIRIYIILGQLTGWLIYRFTIGRIVYPFILKVLAIILPCMLKMFSKCIHVRKKKVAEKINVK